MNQPAKDQAHPNSLPNRVSTDPQAAADSQRQVLALLSESSGVGEALPGSAPPPISPLSQGNAREPSLKPGDVLDGKLRILASLGKGGMGEVYVAWHETLEREVAVKVLPTDQSLNQEAVIRFRKSIAAHAQTGSHPNIAAVMDAGEFLGNLYLVMERVAGSDLAQALHRRHPIPWREVCDWIRQAASGLGQAHRSGLVHRDIKPSNLIRAQDGTVKLLDWGLVRAQPSPLVDAPHDDKNPLFGLGTADYVSPEQSKDANSADARSDLYSLGCTFYELLNGKSPFAHHRARVDKLAAHNAETPPSLSEFRPDVPPEVRRIIARLMEKDPQRRFATATDLEAELSRVLQSHAPTHNSYFLKRRLVQFAILVVAVVIFSVLRAGHNPPNVSTSNPLVWQRLALFVAPDIDDKSQPYDPIYTIVEDGKRQASRSVRDFSSLPGKRSGFKLEGRLSQAVPWAIGWIDPAGKFTLAETGYGEEVAYPELGHFATVDASDPMGMHLILVLTTTASETENSTEKSQDTPKNDFASLNSIAWKRPPAVASDVWVNLAGVTAASSDWRGPGESIERDTGRSYLQSIESSLPANVRPQAGFFFRTAP